MFVEAVVGELLKVAKGRKGVVVTIAAVGVTAVAVSAKGAVDIRKGRSLRKTAATRYEDSNAKLVAASDVASKMAFEYGEFQKLVHRQTAARFADWLEANEHLVKRLNFKKVDGVRIRVPNIPNFVSSVESVKTGTGGIVAGFGAGVAAKVGALWGVSSFASASTGTAITTLSGVAAENAVLAWLGGGAVATGGGGVAAGTAVLSAVTVVPALLIGGMSVGIVGAKMKTESVEYAAVVEAEVARVEVVLDLLNGVEHRIEELQSLLLKLAERATFALTLLESLEFDPDRHASEFLRALQLVTAVKEVLETAILDPESGELTQESIEVVRKYA